MEALTSDQDCVEFTYPEVLTVEEALQNPEWDFRTLSGIAEETGIPTDKISFIFGISDIARQSPLRNEDGQALYVPFDRPKSFRERAETVRRVLARDFDA